ncbi:NlpC/P60 family protein [Nocardiopsis mangrovi]|uniref:NlpC/P60 family protein n=1 Tax=Nocardiopsis mangrovi TaxID=1179818 RepID=A0ABV9DU17_9ACTN
MDERHERGSYRRHIATVGFVAFGALVMSTGVASADPTPDEVRDEIEQLEQEYAELAEAYNQAEQDHDAAQEKLDDLEADQQDIEDALGEMQGDVVQLAHAAYTGTDYSSPAYLFGSAGPENVLLQAADLGYLSQNQQDTLANYVDQQDTLDDLTAEAAETEQDAADKLDEAEQAKADAEDKIDEQQALLDDLTAEEQADATSGVSPVSNGSSGSSYTGDASGDAKVALDFIYAQIGDSYSLGANGPDVWDCSSLVQAAWSEAGVSLPRTTYDQVNAGSSVSWDDLQPGDLIFFYGGPDHVGMYVGDGKMVHASNPSKPVAEVPLNDYYRTNFHSAIRP